MQSTRGSGANRVLDRAFAAGATLSVGAVAITGIFVAKIAQSYAAAHNSAGTTTTQGGLNSPQLPGYNSGGQVSVPQQNQAPIGGSNGS